MNGEQSGSTGYDPLYATFDSALMQQVRAQAYGEDIGQHSWLSADELRRDISRLALGASSRLLDIGCGPCGPLAFALRATGCSGAGVDVSAAALRSGWSRAVAAGVQERLNLCEGDLDLPLPFNDRSFTASICVDVILHLRNRKTLLHEVARVLTVAGRFLFTDAGIINGQISNEEISRRSANGYTQFVPAGFNETLLEEAGFRLIAQEDRTASAARTASGRFHARNAHREALEKAEGREIFARQQRYLETVVELFERRALSRIAYLSELAAADSHTSTSDPEASCSRTC